jgi:hypothetical protein
MMYTEQDLDAAVASGALSADTARALRDHVARARSAPGADEEHFRLLSGFNDIFVGIAAIILLVAVGWIGKAIWIPVAGAVVAATAWGLSEYFTRVRRMALPSIILLLAFVAGVAAVPITLLGEHAETWFGPHPDPRLAGVLGAGIALLAAGGAWLHWRRFMVPITVAAGGAALVATAVALVVAAIGPNNIGREGIFGLILLGGIAMFALAMWWDRSDTARLTRRSDVAFWLHLAAAPMIAHPLFSLLGVNEGNSIAIGGALAVLALYLGFGLVALAVDRRALLVSALAYVLFAMTELFRQFGAVELNVALTALVIGSALLLLSAFWQDARRMVVGLLPGGIAGQLPATGRMVVA